MNEKLSRAAMLRLVAKGGTKNKDDRPFTIHFGTANINHGRNAATYNDDGSPVPDEVANDTAGRKGVYFQIGDWRSSMNTGYAGYAKDYDRLKQECKKGNPYPVYKEIKRNYETTMLMPNIQHTEE